MRSDIFSPNFQNIETAISGSTDETALILAAKHGNWGIIEILVEHGADVNVKLGGKYAYHSLGILN